MSDKFLGSGQGSINLSNGSATIYSATLGAASLSTSKPIKTNSVKQLISTNLDIADVNTLQTQLNEKTELTFVEGDTHTAPSSGKNKIYFKTDGNLYKKNNLGEESTLAGGNGLVPIPTETISNITDIDYKSDIEKTTWSDTSLNKYNYYNYYSSPKKPALRTPYVPLDNRAFNVSNEGDLDQAITDQKDNIFITTAFNITSSKVIAFPCKIYGDSLSKPTITGVGITTSLFNVSSDNVFFQNLILTNDNTSSNTNCIFFGFNNDATNNCVHDCVFNTNEFAITSSHYQVQIYNNVFQFIGTPDSHRYILLNRCIGEVLIYNNVFHSNGIFSTACLLINSSNGSTDFDGGHLVVYSNSSSSSYIQRMAIMETEPVNFKLSLIENTIETYTDFFILYGDTMFNGFNEIIAYKNTVTLLPESPGFKGLIGWDTPGAGGDIIYSPVIRASLNVLPNTLRSDYSPLPNSTNDNPIVCFKNTKFTTSLQVLINPLLVGESVSSGDVSGPSSSVDNAVVFFDGATGKILKEHANFKFVTGATYGDQLKVPDIETDDHFSINDELATLDTRTQYQTANDNITTLIGELDVAKIKSYQHNCELQFDDTDATLTADGTVTLAAPAVILSGTINVAGPALTNQLTFTQDQNLISKKYVDDANTNQNTVISTNTAANIGSVTVHSDVSNAGSGAIITTAERTAIGSNTTKTQNIIDWNNNNTVFNGSLECGTVYLDNIRPMGNNGGEIYVYKQNGSLGLKLDTDGNFSVPSGNVSANSVIVNGTTPITNGGSGSIITTAERTAIGSNTTKTQNITATAGVTTFSGTIGSDNIKAANEVAIGTNAGVSQNQYSVAIGNQAGGAQGLYSVAIGNQSGETGQSEKCVAIGYLAGGDTQTNFCVAIGNQAGERDQGLQSVAIGNSAGNNGQETNCVAIGNNAGNLSQKLDAIAIGNEAGLITQGQDSIAIGLKAGKNGQVAKGIAIGRQAGETTQGNHAVAVGWSSGNDTQGSDAVAIGTFAGSTTQQSGAIAIGDNAGRTSQGTNGIAIGIYSGNNNQGANSIAIGKFAGLTNQSAGSIILNATGSILDATTTGTFIKPVRNVSTAYQLFYNPTTGEISYSA